MANVIITMKLMPEGVDTDLVAITEEVKKSISTFSGETEVRIEQKPVAFGLESLEIIFVMDESKGAPDELEKNISEISGVNSIEVVDVRRALG